MPSSAPQLALVYSVRADDTRKVGCREAVRRILLRERGRRWTLYELGDEVERVTGSHYSPTTVSAKCRDLRKAAHGSLDVRCEHRAGQRGVWEVWIS